MSENIHRDELDWDNLDNPVPMNLLDSDFAAATIEKEVTALPIVKPPEPRHSEPKASLPQADSTLVSPEVIESLIAPPLDPNTIKPARVPSQSDTDNFTRLRAEVAAQTTAEELQRQKVEEEEAAQRERLEQWMANARARLQKADEEPTAPGRPPRVRRDPSATMIRRVEMQNTIFEGGALSEGTGTKGEEVLAPGFEDASGYRTGKVSLDGADPMATIIVPANTFVEADPELKTGKQNALERRVAQIRLSESGAETMIMTAPVTDPGRANVRLAMWVLGGLIPIIFGLGVFALFQTGYLEGLEDLIPGMAKQQSAPMPKPIVKKITPVVEAESAPILPEPEPEVANSPEIIATPIPAPVAPKPVPASVLPKEKRVKTQPVIAKVPVAKPKAMPKPVPAVKPAPVVPEAPVVAQPSVASAALTAFENARRNAEASMAGIEVAKPAFRNESSTSARGEAALKAVISEALTADAVGIQSLYERFAMGSPDFNGDIVIGITVHPNGHILEGSISASTTNNPAFDQELLRKVLDWKLRAFPDNRQRYVAVPFHFEPKAP